MTNGPESKAKFTLPPEFTEGMKYYEELRQDPEWLSAHMGKYVGFIGREHLGTEPTFHELATKMRAEYGNGPMVMTQVTEEYPRVIRIRPRIRIAKK